MHLKYSLHHLFIKKLFFLLSRFTLTSPSPKKPYRGTASWYWVGKKQRCVVFFFTIPWPKRGKCVCLQTTVSLWTWLSTWIALPRVFVCLFFNFYDDQIKTRCSSFIIYTKMYYYPNAEGWAPISFTLASEWSIHLWGAVKTLLCNLRFVYDQFWKLLLKPYVQWKKPVCVYIY